MVFLFASTTIVYFLMLALVVVALIVSVIINEWYIFLICLGIVVAAVVGIVFTNKIAAKKYNKTLLKLNYDVHGFLDEQYKFLNKILINKNTRNLIEMNIACGFINNEQYDKALEILSKFEATGYQGFFPIMRFVIFMNQAGCYIELGNAERARPYIQNSEMILRTARLNNTIRYEFNLIFENIVARFNYEMNPNPQTAQALIEKTSARLNFSEGNNKPNNIILHYELGVMYMKIGDTVRADGEFDYILRTGSDLPCIGRVKAYNETGDMNILRL